MDKLIDVLRADARLDKRIHQIQNLRVYLSGSADSLDLSRCLDHIVFRHQIAHDGVIFDFRIERQVAVLILFSTAAPAGVISSQFL